MSRIQQLTRREFLASTAAMAASASGPRCLAAGDKPIRVAAVMTCFTYRSHAHVILENFLEDYLFNGKRTSPGCKVVSFYIDQFPQGEMGRAVAKEYGIPIFPTIEGALTLGGKELAVDGVLSIGEHGDYPINEKGQQEYPRKRFFDGIVAAFEKTGSVCPVFNDKHLSYRWDWAKEMVDTAQAMGFALMAGSSVPLAQRIPPLELPERAKMIDAVSVHGGGVESYDFHGLEVLQSMLEGRAGGETGVREVRFLDADALRTAAKAGLWSVELAEAAMRAEVGPEQDTWIGNPEYRNVHGILVTYKSGPRAIMLKIGDGATRWNFACRLEGDDKPRATSFYVGPWDNRNLFRALSHAIQIHFREKRPPYPVERTLLTSGVLAAAMDSRFDQGRPIPTDWLDITYKPVDFRRCREMGESWKLITPNTPEPPAIHRYF